ncbi:MAG: TetR/AcrR family transcriptional regulator [Gammaproteobacteria bacterium]|nr:TetR/AcrR family transcriptional regulator [Gammaproteobacteria bacterium]
MARPASFDREKVLGCATEAFWENGYCATSISQLVEATQLQPGSLYAAFDSKQGLFLAALDHYARQSLNRLRGVLAEAADPLEGIRRFFGQLVAGDSEGKPGRGCLLVNTALEVGRHDAKVQARVKAHLADIENVFIAALEEAQAQGLLATGRSPQSLARFLMTTIWGLRVLGGIETNAQQARLVVDQALSVFDA